MHGIRRCGTHGWFVPEGATGCPTCGADGGRGLDGERRRRLSTFLSGALRHFPGDVGLTLTDGGWARRGEVAAAVVDRYGWAAASHVDGVVATDPKGRYEVRGVGDAPAQPRLGLDDGDYVRTAYGHSVPVDLAVGPPGVRAAGTADDGPGAAGDSVPDRLYHGTAPRNRAAIEREGLRPMGRQSVHLSGSVETAREVGRRHAAAPVVFAVDVAVAREAGHGVTKRGSDTYLTDHVPPAALSVIDRGADDDGE